MKISYTRPLLYPKQFNAIYAQERYACIEASTKSGKTHGCIVWLYEKALFGEEDNNYWWVAPVYSQAKIAFDRMKKMIRPWLKYKIFKIKEDDLTISIKGHGKITFKSGEKPDNLYGDDVYGAVVDEASRLKEASWFAVRSTLTATEADVRLIGNVRGKSNWFYKLCRLAEAGRKGWYYDRLNAYDAIDGGILSPLEIEDARGTLPEDIFNELYMAIATDDNSNPFGEKYIYECTFKDKDNNYQYTSTLSHKDPVVFGVDIARKRDFFVIIGLDEDGNVCRFYRWKGSANNIGWEESVERVWAICGETPTLVDSTGIGDIFFELLTKRETYKNYQGYNFSLPSKQKLMEGLAVSIQGHRIGFPEGPIQEELLSFEYQLVSKGVSYSAPDGMYDDCVCALALANKLFLELTVTAPTIQFESYGPENGQINQTIDAILGLDGILKLDKVVKFAYEDLEDEDFKPNLVKLPKDLNTMGFY